MTDHLRIVRLEAENVKRLVAVAIEPDGSLVIVGGRNGQGKTSVLDSIAYALGGQSLVCEQPLRDGAQRGHVEVDLGEIVVRREFTAAGTSRLTVASREGARFPSPQAMLDRLVGPLSFDPLAFTRMKPADQVETLRGLVGIDFAAIDAQRAALYESRTVAGREAKRLDGALRTMPAHPDAPAEEVSVADLMAELERSQEAHRAVEAAERGVHDLLAEAEGLAAREQSAASEIAKLQQQIRDLEAKARSVAAERALVLARAERERGEVEAQRLGLPDLAPVRERIANADAINRAVREKRERAKLRAEAWDALAEVERLSGEIAAIDEDKAAQLAAAKFPVEGLSFDASRVLLRGLPFDQASSAEQIRVSMAMAFAANPRLKIALVRDASLLDEESLALVAQMAAEADAQVWLEVVRTDGRCSVVLEDGRVA